MRRLVFFVLSEISDVDLVVLQLAQGQGRP